MDIAYFVTGMGRSGTMWLAYLLNRDPRISCGHERLGQMDSRRYGRAYAGAIDVDEWLGGRALLMERIQKRDNLPYAEVNSYLRYIVPQLHAAFDAPVAGLVRDGRYVVRSLMKRGTYQRHGYPPIQPPDDVPDDAFAKCCWYWADVYRRFERQEVPVFKLEELNRDYAYFRWMCDYLGTTVNRAHWEQAAKERIHVGIEDTKPPDWNGAQRLTFAVYAGDVQERFGYAGTAETD